MASQEMEEGLLEIREDTYRSKGKCKSKGSEEEISRMQKIMETHMVVAALIATVTFAAGFTLPGGYIQSGGKNEGLAVLSCYRYGQTRENSDNKIMSCEEVLNFKYFLVADSIALVFSVCAIGVYFYASLSTREESIMKCHLFYGTVLTVFAMAAMVLAFVLGLEVVTNSGHVSYVFLAAFLSLLLVPWFLKAPSPLICVKGVRASSWGCKQTKNFILFSTLYGVGIFLVNYFQGWTIFLGFPMLLFTLLLHDYL